MLAYYVHDAKKKNDLIIIPDMGCSVAVDSERVEKFISAGPSFAEWSGDACGLPPEDFGTVVATRDEAGDVCVLDNDLWRERMACYSTGGKFCR